jgi:hypothetical protein
LSVQTSRVNKLNEFIFFIAVNLFSDVIENKKSSLLPNLPSSAAVGSYHAFTLPVPFMFPISPGPFIGPVEIRGKKNKKKIFLFSLLSTDGGLNLVPKG